MPRGDRTGPRGQGPRTGRGLGYCAGYDGPGFVGGRPCGLGRRFGRGPRRGFRPEPRRPVRYREPYREPSREEETDILREEKEALKREMEDVRKRLRELEGEE